LGAATAPADGPVTAKTASRESSVHGASYGGAAGPLSKLRAAGGGGTRDGGRGGGGGRGGRGGGGNGCPRAAGLRSGALHEQTARTRDYVSVWQRRPA
jgi:hypothetical protein